MRVPACVIVPRPRRVRKARLLKQVHCSFSFRTNYSFTSRTNSFSRTNSSFSRTNSSFSRTNSSSRTNSFSRTNFSKQLQFYIHTNKMSLVRAAATASSSSATARTSGVKVLPVDSDLTMKAHINSACHNVRIQINSGSYEC
jgi:hypothetical protein